MSSAIEMLQSAGDGDSPPHYKYRLGDTYDNTTDKLLLNTKINHGEKIVVSDRTKDDYTEFRPHKRNIDIVNARFRHCDAIYKHPILPGYEGFVPRVHGKFGQRFTVLATEALSEMEEEQMKDRLAVLQTTRQTRIQDNSYSPTNAEDRQLIQSEFKLPLLEVRPQAVGVLRNLPVDEPIAGPMHPGHTTSPYFKDCLDPEKRFMTGYAGHIPYGYSRYGETFETYSRSALCDFTSNYRRRQSAEWAPVAATRPDPPLLIQPTEIYPKHIGMLPRYEGHIPGSTFRCGKTFGNDTRDAKCWLRGDYKT